MAMEHITVIMHSVNETHTVESLYNSHEVGIINWPLYRDGRRREVSIAVNGMARLTVGTKNPGHCREVAVSSTVYIAVYMLFLATLVGSRVHVKNMN